MKLTMDAILIAQNNRCVDAARNGGIGRRARLRKPLRLPPEVWDDIRDVTTQLQRSFPDRYVTLNSTVEFLVAIAIERLTEEDDETIEPTTISA